MRVERGLVFALGAAVLAACASGSGGAGGGGATAAPSTNRGLPQVQCNGAPLASTTFASAAQDALNRTYVVRGEGARTYYQTALAQSQQGIAADANNPLHYYLAGQAHLGMDQVAEADSMFDRAEQLCPGFTAEIAPLRLQAYNEGIQAGVEAVTRGDTASAIAAWTRASGIHGGEQAPFNLSLVYASSGDQARAGQYARETLRVLRTLPADTSATAMSDREEMRTAAMQLLFNGGVTSFQANDFNASGAVFRELTEMDRNYREAWTNYTFSLYKQERWSDVVPVAQRLLELDPLNENAMLVLAEAFRRLNNPTQGLAIRERLRDAPVYVTDLNLRYENNQAIAAGRVVGNAARAGTPIRLLVTFSSPRGDVGTQTVTVAAPAKEEATPFEVRLDGQSRPTSFRYQQQ